MAPEAIRAQIERIAASALFQRNERLARFLNFITEAALSDSSKELKEYTIGVEVFDRSSSFDPKIDPIVRINAGRLRAKLLEYYEAEGISDPIRVTIPKGGYTPAFTAVAATESTSPNVVAILPIASFGPDHELSPFSDGLTEELTHRLAAIDTLRIVARTSTAIFRDGADVREIGARLGAGRVIEGSVRREGHQVKVTIQLIDSNTGLHLWSTAYEGSRYDLKSAQREVVRTVVASFEKATPPPRAVLPLWRVIRLASIAVVLVLGAWLVVHNRAPRSRLAHHLTQFTPSRDFSMQPAISRDGKLVAYITDENGTHSLWVKNTAGGLPVRIVKGGGIASLTELDISPDSSLILYSTLGPNGAMFVVPSLGGETRQIAANGRRGRFSPDGKTIAFLRNRQPYQIPASGGVERFVASTPELASVGFVLWSPNGRYLLVSNQSDDPKSDNVDWWVIPRDGGPATKTGAIAALAHLREDPTRRDLLLDDWWDNSIYFVVPGRSNSANLWRVSFSDRNFRLAGEPEQLTLGGAQNNDVRTGAGKIVFNAWETNVQTWTVGLDSASGKASGDPHPLTTCAHARGFLSADGKHYLNCCEGAGNWEIHRRDLAAGVESTLLSSPEVIHVANLSADGSTVIYFTVQEGRTTYYQVPFAGGPAKTVCDRCRVEDVSADGTQVVVIEQGQLQFRNLVSGERQPLVLSDPRLKRNFALSPDARWLVFRVDTERGGKGLLAIVPVRPGNAVSKDEWVIVSSEGDLPQWTSEGNRIYYSRVENEVAAVWTQRLDPATKQPVGEPYEAFRFPQRNRRNLNLGFSVARDLLTYRLSDSKASIWMAELPR
jgi:TolB-like protein/Tol biopolymer transport system component